MSDDIVTRLRKEWEYGNNAKGCDYEMFAQAADEIERLRKLMSDYVSLWHQVESQEWTYENTRAYYAKFHEMQEAVRGE